MNCLDTFALIEIVEANPKLLPFFENELVIPDTTMAEFTFVLHRDFGKKTADYWQEKLAFLSKPTPAQIMKEALIFRHQNKKQNLSFFDCVGYIYAQKHKMKFVTGDKAFKGKPNVTFIS